MRMACTEGGSLPPLPHSSPLRPPEAEDEEEAFVV